MKILVYDVAASESGALSILKDFYYEVLAADKNNRWIFVISTPELSESENVEVLRFPQIKKNWLHRLWFDYFTCPKISKEINPDIIFSLQNLIVPRTKGPQVVYLHQSLPFVPYRFGLLENPLFWVYQNIIGRRIFSSVRKAGKVIVQTRWMKQACIDKTGIPAEKIEIIPPRIDLRAVREYTDIPLHRKAFLFPAGPHAYKNHMLILKACKRLKESGITDYQVIFTLTGHENKYAEELFNYSGSEGLNVSFYGSLPREKLFFLYSESVLVFPSYIETFGLPLLEARSSGTIILASDTPFSREILTGYGNSYFFNIEDESKLGEYMAGCISGEIKYSAAAEKVKPYIGSGIVDFLLHTARQ